MSKEELEKVELIKEIIIDLENITLEELRSKPTSNTVAMAYQKGYNEAMIYCTSRLDKLSTTQESKRESWMFKCENCNAKFRNEEQLMEHLLYYKVEMELKDWHGWNMIYQ